MKTNFVALLQLKLKYIFLGSDQALQDPQLDLFRERIFLTSNDTPPLQELMFAPLMESCRHRSGSLYIFPNSVMLAMGNS